MQIIKTTLIFTAVWLIAGCAHVSQSNQKLLDGADNAAATIEADGKINDANGAVDPVEHPVDHANVVVKKAEPVLGKIAVISFVTGLVLIGLLFTEFSAVSKVGLPVAGSLLGGSLLGLFALPATPFIALGLALSIVGLIAYEAHKLGLSAFADELIAMLTFGRFGGVTAASVAAEASPAVPYVPHTSAV